MYILLAVNELGLALQIGFGIVLGLLPFQIARRHDWQLSGLLAIIACISVMYIGGLFLALPATLILAAVFWGLAVLRESGTSWKQVAHVLLGLLIILWTIIQVAHLPVRLHLQQEPARIAGNVAGIVLGIALTASFIQSRRYTVGSPDSDSGP